MSEAPNRVQSPCVEICALDDKDMCIGCYRTANEIIEWFSASDERKREVLVTVGERRAAD